jgi:hypothetical protein
VYDQPGEQQCHADHWTRDGQFQAGHSQLARQLAAEY